MNTANTTHCDTCGSDACISSNGWRCPLSPIAVDASRFEAFEKAFGRLVKRAMRLGCELPTYSVVTEYTVLHFAPNAGEKFRRVIGGSPVKGVRVTGPRPCFAGWSLVATLEPLGGVNLIKSVPGAGELPASFRKGDHCEHCGKSRRRNETFVVRHEDGRMMRVGRSCIGDFLGGAAPESVAQLFALVTDCATFGGEEDESEGGWGAGAPSVWKLDAYLGLVIRDINASGWCPRSVARDRGGLATADSALIRLLGNPFAGIRPQHADEVELAAARVAIEWAASLEGASDFEHNIAAIAKSGTATDKTIGMAAAIYSAHQRHIEREVERREFARASAGSVHIGEIKARLDLTLSVTAIYDAESMYGCTHIHTMVDASGNVFKWFASSERLTIGNTYKVRGTVKSHGEYKGRKETVLTRCNAEAIERKHSTAA